MQRLWKEHHATTTPHGGDAPPSSLLVVRLLGREKTSLFNSIDTAEEYMAKLFGILVSNNVASEVKGLPKRISDDIVNIECPVAMFDFNIRNHMDVLVSVGNDAATDFAKRKGFLREKFRSISTQTTD